MRHILDGFATIMAKLYCMWYENHQLNCSLFQEKIIGLESQCHQQALQQEKLTQELTQLRAQAAKRASRETISCEIQTGKSIEFNPSATSSPNSSPRISPANHHSSRKSPATPHSPSLIQPQFIAKTLTPLKSASPVTAKGHNSYDTRTPNHGKISETTNEGLGSIIQSAACLTADLRCQVWIPARFLGRLIMN